MPLRVSKPPGLNSSSSTPFAMNPSSLAALNKTAASPPRQLRRVVNPPPALVLYIFRVPGRQDFCLSPNKPLQDVITDIDVSNALFYARCDDEPSGRFTVLRRDPARNQTSEVAMAVESASHIDVFGTQYGFIEETYWRMNGNEVMTIKSNFGCTIWHETGSSSFLSPWTGRCVFRPAKGGHSLRCVYSFPRFALDDDAELSELRFNFSGQKQTTSPNLQQPNEESILGGPRQASPSSIADSPAPMVDEFIPKRHSYLNRFSESSWASLDDLNIKRSSLFKPLQTKLRARSNSADQKENIRSNTAPMPAIDPLSPLTSTTQKPRGPRPLESATNTTVVTAVPPADTAIVSPIPRRPKIPRRPVQSELVSEPLSIVSEAEPKDAAEPKDPAVSAIPTEPSARRSTSLSSHSIRRKEVGSGASSDHRLSIAEIPIPPESEIAAGTVAQQDPLQSVQSKPELASIDESNIASTEPPNLPPRPPANLELQPDPSLLVRGPEFKTQITPSSQNPLASTRSMRSSPLHRSTRQTESSQHQDQVPALPPRRATVGASVLDMSLGREKLGGGADGEQAKLGKLIISGEGQQMLDLIVVGNVLMFYRAYKAANLAISPAA